VEAAAAGLGAALVRWAERRRVVLPELTVSAEWAERQRAATVRREQLDILRRDTLGAAHSGIFPWR
jgi:hypothetical protein